MKLLEKIKFLDEREIRLLDLPIVHYGTKKVENAKEKYIDFFPNKTFEEQVIEEIVNFIDDKYDSIYLLRSGLGEAYLVNFLIKNWCKKNNSKNPCFLNPKNPQKWWSIFSPLPMCFLNMNWQKLKVLQKSCYSIKNKKIYVFLPSKEIRAICQKYLTNPRPHTLSLLKFVDLDTSSISPINFSFDDLTIEKCRKFLQNKNIDINNFIFISPDALSISALSNDFWNKLEIQLRNLGYYIYQNSKELSISESVYLASCAKSVIALRSGFTEGISSVVEKMFVIYRNLKDPYIPADQVIAAYTLKKYPYVNSENIYEYNAEELSEDLIINSIIENLTKGED